MAKPKVPQTGGLHSTCGLLTFQGATRPGPGWGRWLAGCRWPTSHGVLTWCKGAWELRAPPIRALIPLTRAPLLRPNSPPKAPAPNTFPSRAEISTCEFGEGAHLQSVAHGKLDLRLKTELGC